MLVGTLDGLSGRIDSVVSPRLLRFARHQEQYDFKQVVSRDQCLSFNIMEHHERTDRTPMSQ